MDGDCHTCHSVQAQGIQKTGQLKIEGGDLSTIGDRRANVDWLRSYLTGQEKGRNGSRHNEISFVTPDGKRLVANDLPGTVFTARNVLTGRRGSQEELEALARWLVSLREGTPLQGDAENANAEEQVQTLIAVMDEADRLVKANDSLQAAALVDKVRQSPYAAVRRVRERVGQYYVVAGLYEEASAQYRALIREAGAGFRESDETYQSVMRHRVLLAHCLTALEHYEEANSLYLEVDGAKDVEAPMGTLARAALVRGQHRERFERASGLVVVGIRPGEQAERLGLAVGDIVISVNGLVVRLPHDVDEHLRNAREADIQIYRAATKRFETLSLTDSRLGAWISIF